MDVVVLQIALLYGIIGFKTLTLAYKEDKSSTFSKWVKIEGYVWLGLAALNAVQAFI